MLTLGEKASAPPHILGNWPRIEIVFACVDKPASAREATGGDARYQRLMELKKLLDAGALTREEFEREKLKVLGVP